MFGVSLGGPRKGPNAQCRASARFASGTVGAESTQGRGYGTCPMASGRDHGMVVTAQRRPAVLPRVSGTPSGSAGRVGVNSGRFSPSVATRGELRTAGAAQKMRLVLFVPRTVGNHARFRGGGAPRSVPEGVGSMAKTVVYAHGSRPLLSNSQ